MRLWLSFLIAGVLATVPLSAQNYRSGRGVYFPRVPTPQPAVGSGLNGLPGFQPNPGLNGLPGFRPNPGLNGLPAFSSGRIQYPCLGCSPYSRNSGHGRDGNRNRGGYIFPGIVPVFGAYDFGSTFTPQQQSAPAAADPNALSMAEEIGELRGELNSLKSQAAETARQAQTPAAAGVPVPLPVEPATVIVLRNGAQFETTNYAIMDETLWNFSAKPLQKIPLTSIDVAASQKVNATRGVDFSAVADAGK